VLDDYPGVDLREFNVTDRFQYLCAAVVRQYIDAKVTTIPTLLELTKTGENLDVFELIFIPDFVSGLSMLPSFDVKDIYSLLSSRISSGKHFVVYMDAPLPEKSPFIPILKGAFNYPDEFKYPDKWKQAADLERSMNHE
jgi:hypothetical protein